MVTGRRVVIVVVVHRLVGIIVLLLPEEVGVEVSVEVKMCLVIEGQSEKNQEKHVEVYSNWLTYSKNPALTVQALTRPLSHWRVCPCSNRAGSTT